MEHVIPLTYYTLNASATVKTITLTTYTPTLEQVRSIFNLTKNIEIYDSRNPRKRRQFRGELGSDISVLNGVITYIEEAVMANTDALRIIIDDDTIPLNVNVVNTGSLSPTAAPLITSSLVFAAGDVLTTEKLTFALPILSLSSSGNYVISITKPVEDIAGDLTLKLYNQVNTDGVTSTDQYLTTLVIEKITGSATNRSFVVSGLGIGNGTIKVGGFFAADSGAITVNFTIHAIHTEEMSIPTIALASLSLPFAIGEGITEKLTSAIPILSLSPSGNYILSVTKPTEDTAGDFTLKVYNQVKTDGTNSTDQLVTTRTVEKITGSATNRSYTLYGIGIGEGTIKIGGSFTANCAVATTVNFVINAI